ncbi:MAG TPA: ATP-binding protein [Candidatus Angelobacter sp.]|jgi:hypothetical protein
MTSSVLWQDASQASLCRELDRVYHAVVLAAGGVAENAAAKDSEPTSSPGPALENHANSLERISQLFSLSAFERDLLLLCAGCELESRFGQACANAQKDVRLTSPTFGLALATLPGAHWSAVGPDGPLRYWKLIEVGAGSLLLTSPLRIDERILHYIVGLNCRDERLESLLQPLMFDGDLACQTYATCAEKAVAYWQSSVSPGAPVILAGNRSADQRNVTREICRMLHWRGLVLRASDIYANAAERQLARLCNREALLTRSLLCIETTDIDAPDVMKLSAFLKQIEVPVVTEIQEGSPAEHLKGLRISIPRLGAQDRKLIWLETLGADASRLNGGLDRVVECFDLDHSSVRLAGEMLRSVSPEQDLGQVAWETCRSLSRRALEGLAQRIEPRAGWDELVLPGLQTETLKRIVAHVRQRSLVHGKWGFADRYSRGLGVTVLFAGSSGTGKTMAAEVIAAELELDLYQIDLAGVVSKYIGETEKNLRRIFDAAEDTGAVLLFDEADALFGKRSEVKDSHDRYANLEISYLLQRMESYRGLAILTTNMKHALDPAFLRRLRFIVQFPFPDAGDRRRMWERVFPKQAPVGALDYGRIAQLNVAGGLIRNIATHAAFLAADEGTEIDASHIFRAARVEYAKIDRPLTPAETAGWA